MEEGEVGMSRQEVDVGTEEVNGRSAGNLGEPKALQTTYRSSMISKGGKPDPHIVVNPP